VKQCDDDEIKCDVPKSPEISIHENVENLNSFQLQEYELNLLDELKRMMSIFIDERKYPIGHYAFHVAEAFNLVGIYLRKIIHFCKGFDAFRRLSQDDQVVTLKAFYAAFQATRFAFMYNQVEDGFAVLKVRNCLVIIKID